MRPLDVLRAVLVAVIWGLAFVATRIGLAEVSPPELTALRFALGAVPAVFRPRPPVSWSLLIMVGLTLFTGQFLFQFFGISRGMPPGLAAIVVRMQALFTILFAALALRERPSGRQCTGMALTLAGLAVIATTVGRDLTAIGLGLTLASAVSWGVANILVKRLGRVAMLDLVVWLSLVPVLPALLLSLWLDGSTGWTRAVGHMSWTGLAAIVYLGLIATVFAYAIWGDLLRRYPAAVVTPFALLTPFVAASASALAFGENFGSRRLGGMALVLLGLGVIVLSWGAPRRLSE